MIRTKVLITVALIAGGSSRLFAQNDDSVQQQMAKQFTRTGLTPDRSDVVTPGTVVKLRKYGFVASSSNCNVPYVNHYDAKKGMMSQPSLANVAWDLAKSSCDKKGAIVTRHQYRAGESFFLVAWFVSKKDSVTLRLYSDPFNGVRFWGDVKIPFADSGDVLTAIAEVLEVVQPSAPPTEGGLKPIEPPPPPPDATTQPPAPSEPARISLGMTPEQVVAVMGQPTSIADLGPKQIYTYKDPAMKITFVEGKLTDMQ